MSLHQVSVYVQFLEGLCKLSELEEATRLSKCALLKTGSVCSSVAIVSDFSFWKYLIELDNGRLKNLPNL